MPANIIAGITIVKAFEWIWKNFGSNIAKSSSESLWKKFQFKQAAKRYAEDMQRQYGFIQILDMTAPVPLEGLFTQVNVLSIPTAFRRGNLEHIEQIYLGKAIYGEAIEKGRNALEVVKQHNRLFILGKPGAGKTTLLKYLVLVALQGKELDRIPIFVRLREFSESGCSLCEFIIHQFTICDFPDAAPFIETILRQGKALVLCDSLDEVNIQQDERDRVIRELTDFSNTYDESQVIITCRVAASEYRFSECKFIPVEMADFEKEQIHAFVTNWFTHSTSSDATANRLVKSPKDLINQFFEEFDEPEHMRLHDLAKTPLILTLLCVAYEATLEFPARRSEIYEEAFNTLLRKWDTSRNIKRDTVYYKLTLGRKRQMFARIAAETFEQNEYLMKQEQLAGRIAEYLRHLPPAESDEDIDGETILKSIEAQHGIFVECTKGVYSFFSDRKSHLVPITDNM